MVNLFDSENYPTTEPEILVAGDFWAWKRPDIAKTYDAAEYTLSYVANGQTQSVAGFSLAASGDEYTVSTSDTVAYVPGDYQWQAYITKTADGARVLIASGYWEILPNISSGPIDTRSHAKIVLDAVEAVIEGSATKEQSSISIAGRALSLRTYDELRQMRTDYRTEVESERQSELKKQGKGSTNKILTRFPA